MLSGLLVIEGTLALVVFTASTAVHERPSLGRRVVGAVLWPYTIFTWFSNPAEILGRMGRFGLHVWFLVTFGWLVDFLDERAHIALAWPLASFAVCCVDAMSNRLFHKPCQRVFRALLWPKAFAEYLCAPDATREGHASAVVFAILTTCWLLGLVADYVQKLGLV